jgi:hypothetical protein
MDAGTFKSVSSSNLDNDLIIQGIWLFLKGGMRWEGVMDKEW